MAPIAQSVPIIIGVAQIRNKSKVLTDAKEPLVLMCEALESAIADTGADASAVRELCDDFVSMDIQSWKYEDAVASASQRLGLKNVKTKTYGPVGGNNTVKQHDYAARRVALGQSQLVFIGGAECWYSLNAWNNQKKSLPPHWTPPPTGMYVASNTDTRDWSVMGNALSDKHGIYKPIQWYPLFEVGLRAHLGKSPRESHADSARLYAQFARVAATNPGAWAYGETPKTEEEIATIGKNNRMICSPYPLLMNANNSVNHAFASIITSTEVATQLGIHPSKWTYIHSGAGSSDHRSVLHRPLYHRSFAMEACFEAAAKGAGCSLKDVDLVDLYSCFPVMVKMTASHLGVDLFGADKPLTLCGGNTFFGGVNYSGHAITAMVCAIREGKGRVGLVHGNGEFVTKHHVLMLGSRPRPPGVLYPSENPLPESFPPPVTPPAVVEVCPQGAWGVIETYTFEFDRAGRPTLGFVIGRLLSKKEETYSERKFLANIDPEKEKETTQILTSFDVEGVGLKGRVWSDETGRNWFRLDYLGLQGARGKGAASLGSKM
ncbi:hypothetical protein M427DRAFT_108775 [Gonapodya prolifera JEL478]|uniref:Thiolase-like protein type 1 additional C-terminal domain-containing protein n=1 Tax=Gonapodya prolifera (strain JEL478) TaxID=1344416 RepID=A0A139ARX0_GONPJ|nr:hypothetical protein M427DRAFT_108775 [Gonapodya prolifera JEL478]|eukprot:KXS19404.1 hypothetical protein M427DRAFT_108775 [Gonapodya prolifera JEL478]